MNLSSGAEGMSTIGRRLLRAAGTGLCGLLLVVLTAGTPAHASSPEVEQLEHEQPSALVVIDGRELFRVRGNTAFPPELRAQRIAARIKALGETEKFRTEDLKAVESEFGTAIYAGRERVLVVTESDARLEGVARAVLSDEYLVRVREAIDAYRVARTRDALTTSALKSLGAVAVFVLATTLVIGLWRRLHAALEQRYRDRVRSLGIQSFQIVRAERIWGALRAALGTLRNALIVILAFICLYAVLSLFPWTQGTAWRLLEHVINPLEILVSGFVANIPALLFLAVLYIVVRSVLKIINLFFSAVGRGEVSFEGFEPEWAEPTYKMLRLAVVLLALVVAYPYIPGSGSDAFKGISLFIGVVISLGSSSAVANTIAGYMLTYRRAFRVGDRVRIGNVIGDVAEMRLQVTHLRTVKNEEVVIPNSFILNNEVINYNTLAQKQGLILHTTVGIGYETPWRQVEAMLLMAAQRTAGLLAAPAAFVHQKSLDDFAITYELNVYCGVAQTMEVLYSDLHRNILDVFNEFGVQIMTPAYENDPEQQKVVPKEQWFLPPADRASADRHK